MPRAAAPTGGKRGLSAVLSVFCLAVLSSCPGGAYAQQCSETVEIEVPYVGGPPDVVAECLAKYPKDYCPTPFPTFPVSKEMSPTCDIALVGAGTGGLYMALRLIEEKKVTGAGLCVFEATERVGGRIYSLRGMGPDKDLSVDIGGYRTWPRFTPVTHELITKKLGIPMGCYENELEGGCLKYNIVDKDGSKDGFASMPEALMKKLSDAGARWFPLFELESMKQEAAKGATELTFKNGAKATAKAHVILNIPQRPLLKIVRASSLPEGGVSESTYRALHTVQTEIVTKLYMYYPDAWWYNLNLTQGDMNFEGDATKMLLQGRYHDGHVKCKGEGSDKKCHGFLMTVYAHDYAGEKAMYFRRFQSQRGEATTIISDTDPEGALFLKHAHSRIVDYHVYNMPDDVKAKVGKSQFEITQAIGSQPPPFAVLGTWGTATLGAGGGWHGWTDLTYKGDAMKPLNSYNIHVVNEAYSNVQGWAEGALQLADTVLKEKFGVSSPWPFDVPEVRQIVRQTNVEVKCADDVEVDTNPPGTEVAEDDAHLCFVAGTPVHMADGSVKNIEDVVVGDIVKTGGAGAGKVTAALKHAVDGGKAELAVLRLGDDAAAGEIVGSRTHPGSPACLRRPPPASAPRVTTPSRGRRCTARRAPRWRPGRSTSSSTWKWTATRQASPSTRTSSALRASTWRPAWATTRSSTAASPARTSGRRRRPSRLRRTTTP